MTRGAGAVLTNVSRDSVDTLRHVGSIRFPATWRAPSSGLAGRGWLVISLGHLELEPGKARHVGGWLLKRMAVAFHPPEGLDSPIVHEGHVVPVIVTRLLPPPPLGSNRHLVIGGGDRVVVAAVGSSYDRVVASLSTAGFTIEERRCWLSMGEEATRWMWRDDSWQERREWDGPFMG